MAYDILEKPDVRDAFSVQRSLTKPVDEKWSLRRTALFLVVSNIVLWGAIGGTVWLIV